MINMVENFNTSAFLGDLGYLFCVLVQTLILILIKLGLVIFFTGIHESKERSPSQHHLSFSSVSRHTLRPIRA